MKDEPLSRRLGWPIAWAAVILTMTSVPGSLVPTVSAVPDADKIVHFGLYFVFGALLMRARGTGHRRILGLKVLIAVALFAALDEWHQQFIPGRDMDALDWIADVLGATAGVVGFFVANRRREQMT